MTLRKKRIILFIFAIVFLFAVVGVLSLSIWISHTKNNSLQYVQADDFEIPCVYVDPEMTRQEIKTEIDKLFGNPKYEYHEVDFIAGGKAGFSMYPFARVIYINATLHEYNYIFTLAHELVHLVYDTNDETFCNFQAFKILYESGNKSFANSAINRYNWYTSLENQGNITDYSFSYYVQEYLSDKTIYEIIEKSM